MFVQPFGFIGAGKPSEWVVRNDAFAQYVVMAVPGTLADNLGMTTYYDDISSIVKGSGTNLPMKPSGSNVGTVKALIWASGSVVNSGSYNFATNGYQSSVYTSGSQNATFLPSGIINFGTQSFVIEYWVNYGPSGFNAPPYNKGITSPNNGPHYFDFAGWFPRYRFGYNENYIFYNATQTAGTWYHVAYVRNGASASFYINGNRVGNPTNIGSATSLNSSSFHIMGEHNGTVNYNNGGASRFNDLRITLGSARNYTGSSFTPPQSLIYKS